eukprot:1442439-Prymnesium_polylepis.3
MIVAESTRNLQNANKQACSKLCEPVRIAWLCALICNYVRGSPEGTKGHTEPLLIAPHAAAA